ncbi:MAG: zf-HC2 domain-containing protein [Nitrospirota bacterium]
MNCKAVRKSMSAYIDGQLDETELRAVKGHIAGCGVCDRELRSLQAAAEALRGLEPVNAPADFAKRLKERIDARSGSFFDFIPLSFKIPAGVTALAIAAVIAIYVFKSEQVLPPLSMMGKKTEIATVPSTNELHTDKLTVPAEPAAPAVKKRAAKVQLQAQVKPHDDKLKDKKSKEEKPKQERQDKGPVLIALLIKPLSPAAPAPAQAESYPASKAAAGAPAPRTQAVIPMTETAAQSDASVSVGSVSDEQKKEADAYAKSSQSKDTLSKEKSGDISDTREPERARRPEMLEKKETINPLDTALSKIVDLLPAHGAKVAAPQTGHRLLIDIPAENYDSFLRKLQSIGVYNEPLPRPQGDKTIRVQIQLTSN